MLTPFLLGLGVFTFILLIARLLKLIELVVSRGLPPLQILRLLGYLMPAFLEVTVPMAMLLAILVAFGRLSADAEMIAMRSSGVSLYQLAPPVITFVGIVTFMTAALARYARPWGNRALPHRLWDIARTRATAGLRPQVFNDEFPGLVIYAEQIDSRGTSPSGEGDVTVPGLPQEVLLEPELHGMSLRAGDGHHHGGPVPLACRVPRLAPLGPEPPHRPGHPARPRILPGCGPAAR